MKNLILSALLVLTTLSPAVAQSSHAATYSGTLPGFTLVAVISNPKQKIGYEYRVGSVGCGIWSGGPAETFAFDDGRRDDATVPRAQRQVEWVVERAYDCWARQGLVAPNVQTGPISDYSGTAAQYALKYVRACGLSVAPLGLPDPRPSRCSSAPNFN